MSIKTSILLFLLTYTCLYVKAEESYICNQNHLCIKGEGNTEYKTQNECRLSCGPFGSLWPHPTGDIILSEKRIYFDPSNVRFNIVAPNAKTQQFLSDNSRLFKRNIIKECPKNGCNYEGKQQAFIKLTVNSDDMSLDWDTNESYNLTIGSTESTAYADIKAQTIYGARLGLETLSQLITGNDKNGLVMVAIARITDKPAFKHRGLLLDTARNFIPTKNIKKTLDAMATSKMNVFHWHATDSHSFPIEIPSLPYLQRLGAYSNQMKYSKAEMDDIIKYARIRGIRTIIEFDGPAHVGSGWQFAAEEGLGDLVVCQNAQPWRKFCIQPPCGQFNPIHENLYPTIKHLFNDIADMIPLEETIHMGGDEVFLPCWNSSDVILDYLNKNHMSRAAESFYQLWSDYHEKNLESWDQIKEGKKVLKKPVIVWSSHLTYPEVIENYFPKDRYIIQTWVGGDLPLNKDLLQKGYKIIVSTKDAWYLDHGFWGITQYYNWKKVYLNEIPRDYGVLGGEVCMWSEFVDEQTLDGRIWPRAGAAAERLWSDPKTQLTTDVEPRFLRYRQRLITRGIEPDAIVPRYCELNEGQCS